MNNTVFFEFKKENVLDELIKLFKEKGEWDLYPSETDFLHFYQWPDIVLSDRRRSFNNQEGHAIELLGSYSINDQNKSQVTIYMSAILDCVNDFIMNRGLNEPSFNDKKKYVEILSEIILIHQFVHWLIDVGSSPKLTEFKNKKVGENIDMSGINEIEYISKLNDNHESVSYHESFAQIFTNYFCNKIGGIHWELFEWLEKQQDKQYIVYKDLFSGIWAGRDLIIGGVFPDQKIQMIKDDHLEQVFDLLNFTRELNLQSFSVLEAISSNYSLKDKDNKCYVFFEKIINSYQSISGDCFKKTVDISKTLHPELYEKNRGKIAGVKYGLD